MKSLIALICLLPMAGGWLFGLFSNDDRAFDPALWRDEAAISADPFPRQQMVADLTAKHLQPGTPRADVEALLGSPAETSKFSDAGLVYWLGREKGFAAIDSAWLLIFFDDSDGLQRTEIKTD